MDISVAFHPGQGQGPTCGSEGRLVLEGHEDGRFLRTWPRIYGWLG